MKPILYLLGSILIGILVANLVQDILWGSVVLFGTILGLLGICMYLDKSWNIIIKRDK